ncbi:Septin-2 [Sigmodon hispidus]
MKTPYAASGAAETTSGTTETTHLNALGPSTPTYPKTVSNGNTFDTTTITMKTPYAASGATETASDAESDEDEDFKEQTRLLKANNPLCGKAKCKKVRGRLYPWGVVEVENPEHNDFLKLRTMLITHMQDLQEMTQDFHYENFRSERLKRGGRKMGNEDMNKDQILLEMEAELHRCMQEMISRMQAQMQMQGSDSRTLGHHE